MEKTMASDYEAVLDVICQPEHIKYEHREYMPEWNEQQYRPDHRQQRAFERTSHRLGIINPAAEPIPHYLNISGDRGCCPIGIAVICYNRTEILKLLILIFNRTFQPVFRVTPFSY